MARTYTTIINLQNYLNITILTADEPKYLSWIEKISKYIETETGRIFIADTIASIRRYDGNSRRDLQIEETVSLTGIIIDGITITDFLIYPANELPKTRINLKDSVFTKGRQNIEINALWGFSVVVPQDIEFATTVLTAGIYSQSKNIQGIRSEKIGDWNISYDDRQLQDFNIAKKTIQNYKLVNF